MPNTPVKDSLPHGVIITLIAKDKLREAIEKLLAFAEDNALEQTTYHELIILSLKVNVLDTASRKGTIDIDQAFRLKSDLAAKMLALLEVIQEEINTR